MVLAALFAAWAVARASGPLPLASLSYTVDVDGPVAQITVDQTFHDDADAPIDATYVFPLPDDAAVDAMRMVVGDRVIVGDVRERHQAERVYEQAVALGHVAALTTEERPNVFTQHVGNLVPGATVTVELHLVVPVVRKDGAYELVLPLVVAPRFDPDGPSADAPAYVAPAEALDLAPDRGIREDGTGVAVGIDVVVHAGLPIRGVESPTHPVRVDLDGDDASVRLDDVPPTRDFVLRWHVAGDAPDVGMVTAGDHALLTFEPPATSAYEARVPRELVWILDTSCSMEGAPLELAKRAMGAALDEMRPGDSFELYGFDDTVTRLSPRPLPATPENVVAAHQFVGGLQASGGTWMGDAVDVALALPTDPARHRVVCLLTDGQIANDDDVLAAIAARPDVTFTAIGIGSSPNRYLLDDIGRLGGGVTRYVTLAERPEAAVQRMLAAMDRPVLTDVRVDWGAWTVDSQYPARIPDLHAGEPVVVAAQVTGGSGPVRVTGRYGPGTFSEVVMPEVVPDERALASTWARQRIADVHRRYLGGQLDDERPEILAVAVRYHILSDYTAFVAVDGKVTNPGGAALDVRQPLDLPDGEEIVAASGDVLVADVEDTTRGEVLTKDFLAKIPTGRTYQSAVQQVAGVVGGGGGNGNPNMSGGAYDENTYMLDGADVTDPVVGTPSDEMECISVQSAAVDVVDLGTSARTTSLGPVPTATAASNDLDVDLGASGTGGAEDGADLSTRVAGPVARDHFWLATGEDHHVGSVDGVPVDGDVAAARATWQPTSRRRFGLSGSADPLRVGDDRHGGARAELSWTEFASSRETVSAAASAEDRTVLGDDRSHVGATSSVSGDVTDPFGLRHQLGAGVAWDHVAWRAKSLDAALDVARLYAEDEVHAGGLRVSGGLRFDNVLGDAMTTSPRLGVAWDSGDDRTHIDLIARRDADPGLVSAVSGVPVTSREARLDVAREVLDDVTVAVGGGVRDARLPFAPALDLATAADVVGAPAISLPTASADVSLSKAFSRRWSASVRYTWTRALGDVPDLSDPATPWVPGLLDAVREHAVRGDVAWDVPSGAWPLSIAVSGGWASAPSGAASEAAGGHAEWWLGSPAFVGARIEQGVPLRRGDLRIDVDATWAVSDPTALVPDAVVALGAAPASPWRVGGGVSWSFR